MRIMLVLLRPQDFLGSLKVHAWLQTSPHADFRSASQSPCSSPEKSAHLSSCKVAEDDFPVAPLFRHFPLDQLGISPDKLPSRIGRMASFSMFALDAYQSPVCSKFVYLFCKLMVSFYLIYLPYELFVFDYFSPCLMPFSNNKISFYLY
ncbi:unnamed protein product [Protopolystoma xenopodis]|uniref:Uncharacterized protein n=1 Tax=Protopolystoma xenopodis TaxID=117903 RepID=A0A448X9H7_9PLAT|nr:unnamed protein product [Protopolystoma xenopodis]